MRFQPSDRSDQVDLYNNKFDSVNILMHLHDAFVILELMVRENMILRVVLIQVRMLHSLQ